MLSLKFAERWTAWLEEHDCQGEEYFLPRPLIQGSVRALHFRPKRIPPLYVVYVHGTGNDALYPALSLFQKVLLSGYGVFSFDLDGHGQASSGSYHPAHISSALAAALTGLQDRIGPVPLVLIGHSLGALLSLNLAATSDRFDLRGLVLLTMPLALEIKIINPWSELLSFTESSFRRQRSFYGVLGSVPAFGPIRRQAFPLRLDPSAGFGNYPAAIVDTFNRLSPLAAAPQVSQACLCIYGGRDPLAPIADGTALCKLLPKAELLALPKEGHLTTMLSLAAESAIMQWLASLRHTHH